MPTVKICEFVPAVACGGPFGDSSERLLLLLTPSQAVGATSLSSTFEKESDLGEGDVRPNAPEVETGQDSD